MPVLRNENLPKSSVIVKIWKLVILKQEPELKKCLGQKIFLQKLEKNCFKKNEKNLSVKSLE